MQKDLEARDRFMITLEWLLALHERYPSDAISLGLLHICFHNQQQLGEAYGAADAYHMLSNLGCKLRAAFRKTDQVARMGGDFWILTPYTTPEMVVEKISTVVEVASADGLNIVDRDITYFALPNPSLISDAPLSSAVAFLGHLKKHSQQIACHWEGARPSE